MQDEIRLYRSSEESERVAFVACAKGLEGAEETREERRHGIVLLSKE